MFVGEAPGADEDARHVRLSVSPANWLTKIIEAHRAQRVEV